MKNELGHEITKYTLEERITNFMLTHFIGQFLADSVDKVKWRRQAIHDFIVDEIERGLREKSSLGGQATLEKHGKEHFSKISKGWIKGKKRKAQPVEK